MRRRRIVAGVLATSLVAVLGYGTLDVYDRVPGVLTRSQVTSPTVGAQPPTDSATGEEQGGEEQGGGTRVAPVSRPEPPLQRADLSAPVPTTQGLRHFLAARLHDKKMGNSVGVTVRDALTGRHLLDVHASEPRTPASTTKLLTAAAVSTTLDLDDRFTTRAVQGRSARSIVLVAGGDSLLAPGKGDPTVVSGHAGLDDLAAQVKRSLRGKGPVHLTVDDSYARGPQHAPGWSRTVINLGYVGDVAMLGLSTQRAYTGHPAAVDPVMSAAAAFRAALDRHGLKVEGVVRRASAPKSARSLGSVRSATVGEVLELALDDSDNSLTEQLARIAAVHEEVQPDFRSVADWVRRTVKSLGIDVTGVHLVDSCGLSSGTTIPARVLGDVLQLATTGREPALQRVLSHLPVAGLSGTLRSRFLHPDAISADGIARAKTGSLPGVSALAGTVVDRDGRLLVFVLLADNIRPPTPHQGRTGKGRTGKGKTQGKTQGKTSGHERPGSKGVSGNAWVAMVEGRAALDAFVARLAQCGCSG